METNKGKSNDNEKSTQWKAVCREFARVEAMGMKGAYRLANMGVKVQTDYDADQEDCCR